MRDQQEFIFVVMITGSSKARELDKNIDSMGPPKATPAKNGNTLFSYFSKSPSVNKNNSSINGTDEVLSPKRSPNQKDKSTANSTPKQTPKSAKTNDELSSGIVRY